MTSYLSHWEVQEIIIMSGAAAVDNNSKNMLDCANCGKSMRMLVQFSSNCKMLKYCSRDCQKAHCKQHKRECMTRAAELHDEKLFKQRQPRECGCHQWNRGEATKYVAVKYCA